MLKNLPLKWIVICLLSVCTANSYAAKKIDAAKEDLSDLHEKIDALKKELDQNQEAHKDAADSLKESETAISAANRKLREITQKQNQNKNALSTLKKQSLTINERLNQQQKQLSALLKQQYMRGNQSYTQLILQDKNPSEIARDVKYFSYIAKEHATLIDDMQTSLNKVKDLNNQTAAALQKVAELKAKQEAEKKELEAQKKEKAKVVKSLSKQISAQRSEIKKLSRDEKNLSQLVERLAKIVPKKKPKPTKKPLKKNNTKPDDDEPQNQTIAKNEQTPTNAYSGISFATLKGKLNLPVRGELTNRFGGSRQDTGISWKGLFIRAAEGTDVKSVAGGRVIFADWMRGFGNLIIIDHGDGYMSLYGNNQAVFKRVGDDVDGGDSIAAVGNSGGNESNGLYYELRRQSKPFDPLIWSVVR